MRALKYALRATLICFGLTQVHTVYAQPQQKIDAFVDKMVSQHQFDAEFVRQTLAKANINQAILEAIARPWEAKPWYQYYPIFLTEKRLAKGVEFWRKHAETLKKAQQETGVPAQIITAIIGVETFYGTYKGKYSVLDALYTLGFYYPPRATFFASELEQYFLLTREEGFAMDEVQGSYAGAMGWGQFISSSYRHYAIDFDGDGVRDLLNNPTDAIGSVANYFKKHGWKNNQAVAYPVSVDKNNAAITPLIRRDLKYMDTWQDLLDADVALAADITIDPKQSVKLLEFELQEDAEYWVGLPNFYVITRYNHSPLYAMAVFQFSEQLKQAMEQVEEQ
ncbi:lytic murein transglycosylase B [Aliiglaciecola litoralis]|uniref:Lytic murein transglycosylase B n=1 Tax=Aliiglaciecola litoralis TaxID=582857 RepID=A0ABN1LMA8_9ALTE